MGEAKRRSESVNLKEIDKTYKVMIVRRSDAERLLAELIDGVKGAAEIHKTMDALFKRMSDQSKKTMLCLMCDHEFEHRDWQLPEAVALIKGKFRTDTDSTFAQSMVASPICAECAARSDDALKVKVNAQYRKQFPGLYELKPVNFSDEAGRA
ncbi:hypothetical protein AMST5_02163 [freshwater sediment metagenome]|uniref:Uncharacterized protein n=1 Tax=freshwater sediment metagenome TaxID=556182 RepID=A0AA48M400_9ZZZZ